MSTLSDNTIPRIVTDWQRFSMGLWRKPEGDIFLAYSADILPKVTTFTEESRLFTSMGMTRWTAFYAEASCFLLIPADEYHGPEPRQYSYEGCTVRYKGQPFRLGPKTHFVSSPLPVDECRQRLRILYADGGLFACQPSYDHFLIEFRHTLTTPEACEAHRLECFGKLLEFTKREMVGFLAEKSAPRAEQLEFGLLPDEPLFVSTATSRLEQQ